MRKKILIVLGIIIIASSLIGCVNSELKTVNANYRIGVIVPLSGPAAAYGEQMKRIFDYRLAEMEKAGWPNGRFELKYEDGKCDGNPAATALQKLTDVDDIHFIIGGACSSESLGMAPLLVSKNAVAISPTSSNPELEGKSPNFFSLSYSDKLIGENLADELGKFKKVALISEQNDYNQGIKRVVESVLAEKYPGTQVVANEEFPKGATDMRNSLDKIKNADPEAVLLNPNVGVTTEVLLKQLAEIRDWKPQLVSIQGYLSADIIKVAPETLEGMIVIDAPKVNDAEFLSVYDAVTAQYGTLGDLGNFYAATTFDGFNILTKTIGEAQGDVAKVQQALSTQSFDGYVGTVSFGGKTYAQGIRAAKFVIRSGKAQQLN